LAVDDILYIAADGDYSRVHLANGTNLLVWKMLKDVLDDLNSTGASGTIIRVHRSFAANFTHVHYVSLYGNTPQIFFSSSKNNAIPVGKTFKINVETVLHK
jgi:DNA-binding LytR/AlgR family response regulator